MNRADFFCSERHYVDHLLPVYLALPEKFRGEFHVGAHPANPDRLTVVSSYGNYRDTKGPVVMFEHGSGFSYNVKHPAYAGSPDRERVVLFCSPNEFVAGPNAEMFPDTPQVIVGSPRLDRWVERGYTPNARPRVVFSFHWDCQVQPETRSAFSHYSNYFNNLHINSRNRHVSPSRWDMYGHGHPLAFEYLRKQWSRWGIPELREFNDALLMGDVYVCDTSSTLYEWAALGRPTVVLNAPWYRREVRQGQGLRFWDNIPGIQVDHPQYLNQAIEEACFNDTFQAERERITALVYPHLGDASRRAADAIVQLLS